MIGGITAPKIRFQFPKPVNDTSFGKTIFADVIYLRILGWRVIVGHLNGPRCHHMCPYNKGAEGDLTPAQRKGQMTTDTEIASSHQELEEARNRFSHRPSGGRAALLIT